MQIPDPSRIVTDHLGRQVSVPAIPQRIVSLCPSQTETLFTLGLGSRIAGRTLFCIHPQSVKNIPAVGGTKNCTPERILALQPDLVIAEKEENTPELVAALEQQVPVFVTDVHDLDSAVKMVADLEMLAGDVPAGLSAQVQQALGNLPRMEKPLRTLYLIWHEPWMAAGANTFIHAMMERYGLHNLCAGLQGRYPQVDEEIMQQLNPELVLFSSEPFPFKPKHITHLRQSLPHVRMEMVDGEMFSWYGSRLLETPAWFSKLKETLQNA